MNIFKELYYGNLSEFSRSIKNNKTHKQLELYEVIKLKLGDDNAKLIDDFWELESSIYDEVLMDKYINGFKTGLLMGINANSIDLS